MHKLDIQAIKDAIKDKDIKLLSTEYKNLKTHYLWECPDKHQWMATAKNVIHNNSRCPHCRIYITETKCRFIIEQLTGCSFKKSQKVLPKRLELDGYCKSLNMAFEYNGEQHYIKLKHIKQKHFESLQNRDVRKRILCRKMGISLIAIPYTQKINLEAFIRNKLINRGLDIQNKTVNWKKYNPHPKKMKQIRELLSSKQIECLTNSYDGSDSKLDLVCHICNHEWQTAPSSIIHANTGCPKCNKTLMHSIKEVKLFCESRGIRFKSSTYEGRRKKYAFECAEGHSWISSLVSIKNGSKCPFCYGNQRFSQEWIVNAATKLGYAFLSPQYKNQLQVYDFQCTTCGHTRKSQYTSLRKKPLCPQCRKQL